jgi:hypothetical protein
MAEQISRTEVEHTPEDGLFNVEAMADEQITEVYAALWSHVEYAIENGQRIGPERTRIACQMVETFEAGLRNLGTSNPARLRNLIDGYTRCDDGPWVRAAATSAEALIDHDYIFVRNTLVAIHDFDVPGDSFALESANEIAYEALGHLVEHRLSAEQIADLKATMMARNTWTFDLERAAATRD